LPTKPFLLTLAKTLVNILIRFKKVMNLIINQIVLILIFSIALQSCSEENEQNKIENQPVETVVDSTFEDIRCEETGEEYDTLKIYYCEHFDIEGNKIRDGKYLGHNAIEWHNFYKNNDIYALREYMWFSKNENSTPNQVIIFNEKGDTIISESNFITIELTKDSITLGDTLNFKFNLRAPYFNSKHLEVYFELPHDTLNAHAKRYLTNIFKYEYVPRDTGRLNLRGTLFEKELSFDEMQSNNQKDTLRERRMGFDYKFYVSK
jgi:hypothetical protein